MPAALTQQLNGWIYGAFGAEGLATFQEHPLAYLGGAALAVALVVALAAAWSLRRARSTWAGVTRWGGLVRSRAGRRALRLAAEIRAGARRLRRAILHGVHDPAERRELLRVLERFARQELSATLDTLRAWSAIGGSTDVKTLQRQLDAKAAQWSRMPDGPERRLAEQDVARLRQRLALAQHAAADRERLMGGLEEAAAAIRSLEAELLALGSARSPALPQFRTHLNALAEDFRHQREAHIELQAR